MTLHNRRALLVMTGASIFAVGCGNIIGPGKAPQLYILDPAIPGAGAGSRADWQLTVALPLAPASLDTERIALNPTPATMDYFADASWPDRLPLLMQGMLVESFEKDGRAGSVARDTSGLHADYLLQTEIRSFQALYAAPNAAPDIVLRIDATLVKMPEGNILDRREFDERAHAESNALPAIIAAFNKATGAILADIVNWVVSTAPPRPAAGADNKARRLSPAG